MGKTNVVTNLLTHSWVRKRQMKEDDFGEDRVYSSPPRIKPIEREETRVEVHGETYEEEEMQEET